MGSDGSSVGDCRFRLKYQPDDSQKQNEENLSRLKRRWEVFQELAEDGWLDRSGLDHTNGRNQIRFMDARKALKSFTSLSSLCIRARMLQK